jgi:hypothetical protein
LWSGFPITPSALWSALGIAIWDGSVASVPLLPGQLPLLLATLVLTAGVLRLRSRSA